MDLAQAGQRLHGAAGAAAGFVTVRTEASGALPGVGIAVALVPPLATVGITIGVAVGVFSVIAAGVRIGAINPNVFQDQCYKY